MPRPSSQIPQTRPRKAARPRGRGRPVAREKSLLDRKVIIACAFDLSRTVPLQELSIVRVAKELGVTPALIHYYIDGRDSLTSGIMNAFYREILQDWPASNGEWRETLEAACRRVYQLHVSYPGIAAYVVGHNRFRMAQDVEPGETDYGVLLFERFVGDVREAGFDAERTATYAHLLMEFVTTTAHTTVRHRWPAEHGAFLDQVIGKLDPKKFPNAHFVRKSYVRFDSSLAFEEAMKLFVHALDVERTQLIPGKRGRKSRAAPG